MNLLEYTKERVRAFLGETDRLAEAEFPYWHSRAVIDQLQVLFVSFRYTFNHVCNQRTIESMRFFKLDAGISTIR